MGALSKDKFAKKWRVPCDKIRREKWSQTVYTGEARKTERKKRSGRDSKLYSAPLYSPSVCRYRGGMDEVRASRGGLSDS